MYKNKIIILWLFFLQLFIVFSSNAEDLALSPTLINVGSKNTIATFKIENKGKNPILLQVKMYKWSQHDNKNILQPTREIMVVPPIFSINNTENQTVRVALNTNPDIRVEKAYRMILTDIPMKDSFIPGEIRTLLKISIPVFVQPEKNSSFSFKWAIQNNHNNFELHIQNTGSQHFIVHQIDLIGLTGKLIKRQKILLYLLPHTSTDIPLPRDKEAIKKIDLLIDENKKTLLIT